MTVLISTYQLTRFQFARDRVIGDSQVRTDEVNVAALELIDAADNRGLRFAQVLFHHLPALDEIVRVFETEAWPALEGQHPLALVHRVRPPRRGNRRTLNLAL